MKIITGSPPWIPRKNSSSRNTSNSSNNNILGAGGSREEKTVQNKTEKHSLTRVLKRQFCGCFQPKSEIGAEGSRKQTTEAKKCNPLDYSILKQTQLLSGSKWGTLQFIRDLDPALSEPFKTTIRVCAQHDCLLQENLDCQSCLAHPRFPGGVYSKIDVKPFQTYKETSDSARRLYEANVKFGLWRDEEKDLIKICKKGNHKDCLRISRTSLSCLQSYKRIGRRKLPFKPFRSSSSKLDFEIVVVDVVPSVNHKSQPLVEVEVNNTGAHPIYVQLALHEQQLLFQTNLLAHEGQNETSIPTVYQKIESGESKRLFNRFDEDFYEKLFENSLGIRSALFGSLNIIPQWCKASENLFPFFKSDKYFTYSNRECDSSLAEFFVLNLEWHRRYFDKLKKRTRRQQKALRQS